MCIKLLHKLFRRYFFSYTLYQRRNYEEVNDGDGSLKELFFTDTTRKAGVRGFARLRTK